ncbi:hypothetical protein ABBQ32_011534 [Trebouxia sp. C0010 RCD-2024]
MGSNRGWLLFVALLALSVTAVVNAQDDVDDQDDFMNIVEKAFLLVRHKIDTVELVQGKNTSVVVEIYNAGNSAATDIKLIGAEWPLSDFEDSGGAASGSWNKLSPGATVRVEYFLTPKTSGAYAPLAAKVTYNPESDAQTQIAYGATPTLYILSPTQKLMRTALNMGSYLSLGMVRTPEQWLWAGSTVGGAAALLGGYWAFTVATDANKRKKYRQALEEVTKMS